ncbi:thymidine kinase [Mycoplasma nasistruthionis]|uniref:Thymidine kinase n=1 Tax=Mycoplasma nasistruthionis TaxID=353852 RepID=A0A5B7XXZ3_9MOLU|nr:thymidine kinase [Mycoplasma nasistruthionis]QCZ36783.1 thymidine kinase [Mycoplasma nasistruthionis]
MNLKNVDATLDVITGPMFAGKSEELIRRIKILTIAKNKVLIVKPSFDTRFGIEKITSRNGNFIEAIPTDKSSEILGFIKPDTDVVAIDEVHFFDDNIVKVIEQLLKLNISVIVSGLDMDFLNRPFGVMPNILAIADSVSKLKAVCMVCHKLAGYSFRKVSSNDLNLLGDDEYEARCRKCHWAGLTK